MPIFTAPTEMMGATIHLSMMGGIVATIPVLTVGVLTLFGPLLNRQRRRFLIIFTPALFLCYIGGAAFAYFVMLPVGLRFLLHFGDGIAVPMIRLVEYMSLVTALTFWLGVVFQLPIAMFLLSKFNLVSARRFRKLRRYVPMAAFVLSAIVTPTFDIINQTMVAVPIILLYEVGLVLAWLAEDGHKRLARKIGGCFVRAGRKVKRVVVRVVRWLWKQVRRIPITGWARIRR